MKFYTQSPLVVLCLFFTLITLFSCSKDSDLMADYVALDPEVLIGKYVRSDTFQISIISNSEDDTFEITVNSGENTGSSSAGNAVSGGTVNDSYQTSSSASIVLDVLANDTFNDLDNVSISEISQPVNGEVVINSDNTLTYTPFIVEATEDTFTYTAEFVKEDGTVGKETGNVTVTLNSNSSDRDPITLSANVTHWKELFDIVWQGPGINGKSGAMDYATSNGANQEYYYLGWHLDGVIQMWQATGDNTYLDDAIEIIQSTINQSTPVFGGGYLGWPATKHGIEPKGYPLWESYMYRYVASLLRIMYKSPNLMMTSYADGTYQDWFDRTLTFMEKNIWEKWETDGIHNLYRVNTHMASHWARIGMELYIITGTQKYLDVFNNISYAGAPSPSGGQMPIGSNLRNQLRINPSESSAYIWSSNWNNLTGVQDTSHGADIVSFWVTAFENGMYWDLKDMNALISTLNIVWKNNNPVEFSFNIDGSGAVNDREAGFHNFITLGRFSEALQSRIRSYYNINSITHKKAEAFGIAALNERILLDGRPVYPEIYN